MPVIKQILLQSQLFRVPIQHAFYTIVNNTRNRNHNCVLEFSNICIPTATTTMMTITTAAITAKSGELELAGAGVDVDGDRGGAGATGHTATCTTQINSKKSESKIEIVMSSIVRVSGHRNDAVIDIAGRQKALRGGLRPRSFLARTLKGSGIRTVGARVHRAGHRSGRVLRVDRSDRFQRLQWQRSPHDAERRVSSIDDEQNE
jgi:hypothetical protein